MNSEKVDVIFLLDRSGSMHGSVNDTIGGFNAYLEEQKANEFDTKVTTILFDHGYEVLYKRKDIDEVKPLTHNEYFVRGSTALLDAIGRTITTMEREIDNPVLFVITTDGYENSSREYSKNQIKNMIGNLNWEFIYLGADIDSFGEAAHLGIRRDRVANYEKSSEGIRKMYTSISCATDSMHMDKSLSAEWKKSLEEWNIFSSPFF